MSMTRDELQDAARAAFGKAGLASDADASWGMVGAMGWLTMTVPERLGGLGLGSEAAGVIHTELGRALVRGPAIAQMLVIEALAAADGVAGRGDLLARAMAGGVMTTSLGGEPGGCVPDADRASHLLVAEDGRVRLVPLDGEAVRITPRATWDETRRLFDVTPAAKPEGLVLAQGDAAARLGERLRGQLLLALAGDSLGGADAFLSSTLDYLKTRRQFDRPLAMFQALKHRVADMKTALAAAQALFWSRAIDPAATIVELAALKAHATAIAQTLAEEAIQLHGGIGLTTEHHSHLFLKRAMLNAALGGDADRLEEEVGRHALANASA